MREIIVIYEDSIKIYRGEDILCNLKLKTIGRIYSEENINELKKIIKSTGIKIKKCKVVYAMEGIITRNIKIPIMKKSFINSFISNNIDEYFTVNMEDYYYDYKVTGQDDKEIEIFLAAVPKNKIQEIYNVFSQVNIIIKSINIYPEVIVNYFKKKKQPCAIIHCEEDKTFITIIKNGSVFLFSTINNEFYDEESIQSYSDNLAYFLNFYSSRNYGEVIKDIYYYGSMQPNIKKKIEQQLDINFINKIPNFKGRDHILVYPYTHYYIERKNSIDLYKYFNKKDRFVEKTVLAAVLLLVSTFLWFKAYLSLLEKKINNVNNNIINIQSRIDKYKDVEKKVNELKNMKKEQESINNILAEIKKDEFDYLYFLNGIKNNIPKNVRINDLSLDKNVLDIEFEILDKKTLDIAKLIISLNKSNLFKPIEIDSVELDDNAENFKVHLLLKN